jgi:hypothetical protein
MMGQGMGWVVFFLRKLLIHNMLRGSTRQRRCPQMTPFEATGDRLLGSGEENEYKGFLPFVVR